mgnify:CR=1 FL=1
MSCPMCQKETAPKYRPFCSQRCADLDLGRWMTGGYRIETEEPPEPGDATPERPEHTH